MPTLFIAGLPMSITGLQIASLARRYGPLHSCSILRRVHDSLARVDLPTAESASRLQAALDGGMLDGRPISVIPGDSALGEVLAVLFARGQVDAGISQ